MVPPLLQFNSSEADATIGGTFTALNTLKVFVPASADNSVDQLNANATMGCNCLLVHQACANLLQAP